jgi:essential nuclear protein 1
LRFVLTTRIASHLQTVLDPKTSRRIFELARDQQDELDLPDADADDDVIEDDFTRPRTYELLERIDEDEDEEEEFQGFSDDERELVRRRLP